MSTSRSSHQHLPFLPLGTCDDKICAVEILAKLKMGAERQEAAGSKLAPGLHTTALRLFNDENNHEAVRLGQE